LFVKLVKAGPVVLTWIEHDILADAKLKSSEHYE
jgi:hypothetical protein